MRQLYTMTGYWLANIQWNVEIKYVYMTFELWMQHEVSAKSLIEGMWDYYIVTIFALQRLRLHYSVHGKNEWIVSSIL